MKVEWPTLKAFLNTRKTGLNFIELPQAYFLSSYDNNFSIEVELDKYPSDNTHLLDFETNFKSKANKPLTKKAAYQGVPIVSIRRPEGTSATIVSHDFCNKSTWYQKATQVLNETLSANGLVYSSLNSGWIDLEHGKVYNEHSISDKKRPKIYVGGSEVFSGFTINYELGVVTFDSDPGGVVSSDYYYGSDSCFTLAPSAGKVLLLEHAELQFTKDVQITSPVNFEIWGYNPTDLPNKMLYKSIKYKNIKDVISSANLGQGVIPAIGELTQDIVVFPFTYVTILPMAASQGLELRISMDNNTELGGQWGTVTFYTLSEDE